MVSVIQTDYRVGHMEKVIIIMASSTRWPAAAVGLLVIALAGCGSSPAPGAATTTPPATTASPSATTAPPSATASAQAAGHVPVCQPAQLQIKMLSGGGAGPIAGGDLGFKNIGTSPCELAGWPGVTAVTAAGAAHPAAHALTTQFGPNITAPPTVVITPGALAEAVFTGGTNPGPGQTACPPSYRTLRVAPPGSSQGTVISAWLPDLDAYLPACTQVYVTPVVRPADLRAS
jgi:hypothetical protein